MGFDGMNITHWVDLNWFNGMFMGFTWVLMGSYMVLMTLGMELVWIFMFFFGMLVMDFLGFGLG
jgi:hypothetical protein